jgi:hypothetical protein
MNGITVSDNHHGITITGGSMDFSIKIGDTRPDLEAQLWAGEDQTPVDLTNTTIRLLVRRRGAGYTAYSVSIVTPSQGRVKRVWNGTEFTVSDIYYAEFEVTFPDATIGTYPNDDTFRIKVYDDLD